MTLLKNIIDRFSDFTTSARLYVYNPVTDNDAYLETDDIFKSPFGIPCSVLDEDLVIKNGCAKFPAPFDFTFISAFTGVTTAPVGSSLVVDINVNASTVLSTKITISAGNKNSLTGTQPVFSSLNVNEGDEITIDIDTVGATTAGQNLVLVIIAKRNE